MLALGMAQLDVQRSGRIGVRALTYYSVTTILAAIVGIAMVLMIHPGDPQIKSTITVMVKAEETKVSTIDAILDIIRYEKTSPVSDPRSQSTRDILAIFRSQKHGAREPGASVLPAGADFLREEEGDRDWLESKRVHIGAESDLQGRHERDGHDRVLHHLRCACGPDWTTRQADGRFLRDTERYHHEARHDRRGLVRSNNFITA